MKKAISLSAAENATNSRVSPLPWFASDPPGLLADSHSVIIAEHLSADDAAHIVRAVNTHAELIAALELMIWTYERLGESKGMKRARAALKLAKGE